MSLDVLLAGALGALLVFFLGVLREWWREEQERRGLLILLLAELEHNAEVIRTIYDRMDPGQAMEDLIAHPHFANQKAKTWGAYRRGPPRCCRMISWQRSRNTTRR
jgi:hypothetical protein